MRSALKRVDETTLRLGECRECDGNGEVYAGQWPGSWYEPPEAIFDTCQTCGGTGRGGWEETEPLELEDTTGVLAPEFGKYPDAWPFDPLPASERCRPCHVRQFPRELDHWFAPIFESHPKLQRFQ